MTGNKEAAPAVAAAESGKGVNHDGHRNAFPISDSTIQAIQKQLEREERLLFILFRAARQNGGVLFMPYSTLSCISLIPEDEVRELCDFSALFGEVDG